jgi:hypothetical protein
MQCFDTLPLVRFDTQCKGELIMETQTFASKLWSTLLPRLVCLASIRGFDVWLLHQVHRPNKALGSSSSGK